MALVRTKIETAATHKCSGGRVLHLLPGTVTGQLTFAPAPAGTPSEGEWFRVAFDFKDSAGRGWRYAALLHATTLLPEHGTNLAKAPDVPLEAPLVNTAIDTRDRLELRWNQKPASAYLKYFGFAAVVTAEDDGLLVTSELGPLLTEGDAVQVRARYHLPIGRVLWMEAKQLSSAGDEIEPLGYVALEPADAQAAHLPNSSADVTARTVAARAAPSTGALRRGSVPVSGSQDAKAQCRRVSGESIEFSPGPWHGLLGLTPIADPGGGLTGPLQCTFEFRDRVEQAWRVTGRVGLRTLLPNANQRVRIGVRPTTWDAILWGTLGSEEAARVVHDGQTPLTLKLAGNTLTIILLADQAAVRSCLKLGSDDARATGGILHVEYSVPVVRILSDVLEQGVDVSVQRIPHLDLEVSAWTVRGT